MKTLYTLMPLHFVHDADDMSVVVSLASVLEALRDRGIYVLPNGTRIEVCCPIHGVSAGECGGNINMCIEIAELGSQGAEDRAEQEERDRLAYERAHSAGRISK